jgi:hypothetical protein
MRSRGPASRATRTLKAEFHLTSQFGSSRSWRSSASSGVCQSLTLSCAPSWAASRRVTILSTWGITMTALAFDQVARLSGLGRITITRAIKSCWHSASRKAHGSCEIELVEPEPSARRLHALIPWRPARRADLRADEEFRHQLALAEERLADLKAALEDMRAQRDAWQAMAQARIRPPRSSFPWLRFDRMMSERAGAD